MKQVTIENIFCLFCKSTDVTVMHDDNEAIDLYQNTCNSCGEKTDWKESEELIGWIKKDTCLCGNTMKIGDGMCVTCAEDFDLQADLVEESIKPKCSCGNPLPEPCRVECDTCHSSRMENDEHVNSCYGYKELDLTKEDTLMTEF